MTINCASLLKVKGNDATITYDARTFDVTVSVARNAEGKLTATVKQGEVNFVNSYKAKNVLPNTGETNLYVVAAGIAVVLIAVAAYLIFRFNKKA